MYYALLLLLYQERHKSQSISLQELKKHIQEVYFAITAYIFSEDMHYQHLTYKGYKTQRANELASVPKASVMWQKLELD